MKGDFARVSFDPTRHYSQVFQQQGRVLLEADWNEQAQIQLQLLRSLVRDLVGPCWAAGSGFAITASVTNADGSSKPLPLADWQLAPGHFYVDGILCVNEAACTLAQQPYAPTPDYGVADGKSGFENPPQGYALWLDVWERHLCAVEAPGIADAALDGVDTASRAQVVWQLRMLDQPRAQQQLDDVTTALKTRQQAADNPTSAAAIKQQLAEVASLRKSLDGGDQANASPCALVRQLLDARATYASPRLRAELGPHETDDDPCVIAADARYRGMENQLYRVEIHQGGPAGTASFKWSRENGSVVFPVTRSDLGATADDGSAPLTVTLARLGRDARLGLAANDWVELVDDRYTLGQRAYPLLQVLAIDPANGSVTLNVPKNIVPWPLDSDPRQHPLLRRWDQRDAVNAQGVLAVAEGTPMALEDGVQITFEPGGVYATGEYWLIPARVAGNGQLDWPLANGAPATLPPRGGHHYAVLGVTGDNGSYAECCCRFDSLCQLLQARLGLQTGAGAVLVPGAAVAAPSAVKKARARPVKKAAKVNG
ncbi:MULTISPECIES: DUF6519 domain-containing protein [Rhodanobacter]|uniref:DUF6519 domain-containing protein n=1 Tax=Rhodanobacter TaxID=75309 RepID=UPI00041ECB0B|nr:MULTISPECIES: DUF6519 domain-containing protein [Rhodanobacter]KZC19330.1 hypothetical protein RHOFW104R3_31665 [Rhodanobacter denitrificans]UJJ51580.1 DUF6519 domain-containing protein [Rhodanobacter denitrificans]UJM94325.1 DUF6519 domain-containing protein [Rhodanobacter denitrificans]UJM97854.1 DUF6519 domain-containing protein [Rhodanobacter denitrificans]UJN22731.1 DUF6519 domain-containing protein [Rhodanobacter denitrificans]